MSFVSLRTIPSDYGASISRILGNTLNFENCSNTYDYGNSSINGQNISSRGIKYFDNIILSRLTEYIISNSTVKYFTIEELNKYRFRPKRLSLSVYGVIDYWWIIMTINSITNVAKFDNFSSLLMPDQSSTQDAIDQELFSNPVSDFSIQ